MEIKKFHLQTNVQKLEKGKEGGSGVRRAVYLPDLYQFFHDFRNP